MPTPPGAFLHRASKDLSRPPQRIEGVANPEGSYRWTSSRRAPRPRSRADPHAPTPDRAPTGEGRECRAISGNVGALRAVEFGEKRVGLMGQHGSAPALLVFVRNPPAAACFGTATNPFAVIYG